VNEIERDAPANPGSEIELVKGNNLPAAAEALKAQAIARVQARVMQALARPRDTEAFRVKMLSECKRPGFAEAAKYSKPMGGEKVEGPTIRFAEAALRLYGNLDCELVVVSSDDKGATIRCTVTDLETNSTDSQDAFVGKTVERRDPGGRTPLNVRRNSNGKATYTVEATDDEFRPKFNSEASKVRRGRILAMLPADIVDECLEACDQTCANENAKDPQAAIRKMVDAFNAIGVSPTELKEYVGKDLERVTPKEFENLRATFNGLKAGETTWAAVMEAAGKGAAPSAEKTEKPAGGSKTDRLAGELGKK
jgi:hypothetical protein